MQIVDTGCGIPIEHLPNIKKKFYKANHVVRGSGIGLALADEIITLHNGTLEVESQENLGTAVTIRIPAMQQFEMCIRDRPSYITRCLQYTYHLRIVQSKKIFD